MHRAGVGEHYRPEVPVPCYFLDTYNGDRFLPDDEGIELENLEAAKATASWGLVNMAEDELPNGDQWAFVVRVRYEAGTVVLQAALSLVVEYSSESEIGVPRRR